MSVYVSCHASTKETQTYHVRFKGSNRVHDWVDILPESLWVNLTTLLSNGGSAWRLGGVTFHPIECPKQVDDFNFVGEHVKLIHHVPQQNNNIRTTAKKVAEEPVFGCLGPISHVVGVLNHPGDGVHVGSGEFVTLLPLICQGSGSGRTRIGRRMLRWELQRRLLHCQWQGSWSDWCRCLAGWRRWQQGNGARDGRFDLQE